MSSSRAAALVNVIFPRCLGLVNSPNRPQVRDASEEGAALA
jgi:hypothetical protein